MMANWILKNGKDILCLSNRALQRLQVKISELIESQNIRDEIILDFVERMDQDIYGGGTILLDINNFFKHAPTSLLAFIKLVKEAYLKLIEDQFADQSVKERMDHFIQELESYYNQIKTN